VARTIEGTVVSINQAGNLVSNITAGQLADAPRDERVTIGCGGHETNCILPPDHNEPESTLLAMIGESGTLEIGIVGMSISEMLGLKVGEKIVVKW
jgi:S-adenosylmethionine hydrolase